MNSHTQAGQETGKEITYREDEVSGLLRPQHDIFSRLIKANISSTAAITITIELHQ